MERGKRGGKTEGEGEGMALRGLKRGWRPKLLRRGCGVGVGRKGMREGSCIRRRGWRSRGGLLSKSLRSPAP